MNKIQVKKISTELNISHSAVSQWFSGKTKPKIDHAIKMNELFHIPFEAWKDIESYVNRNISDSEALSEIEKQQ